MFFGKYFVNIGQYSYVPAYYTVLRTVRDCVLVLYEGINSKGNKKIFQTNLGIFSLFQIFSRLAYLGRIRTIVALPIVINILYVCLLFDLF